MLDYHSTHHWVYYEPKLLIYKIIKHTTPKQQVCSYDNVCVPQQRSTYEFDWRRRRGTLSQQISSNVLIG